jgi:hypothetical protein
MDIANVRLKEGCSQAVHNGTTTTAVTVDKGSSTVSHTLREIREQTRNQSMKERATAFIFRQRQRKRERERDAWTLDVRD